ncbi:uncharacterized protein [Ptychodera flava]|uniref:uncharacterized protein n=1 Tax=Ptychodera flava TaxID=63121 RepID=UPI00396A4A87
MLAGLPNKENNKLSNIHYYTSSDSVDAMELTKPLLGELKILETHGTTAYDAYMGCEVLVISPLLVILGDNVRQSEIVSHLGTSSRLFCRLCDVDRNDIEADPLKVGNPRIKSETLKSIQQIRAQNTEKEKKVLRTSYGVNEKENPLMEGNLISFRGNLDTPYERLHSLLLGTVRDMTTFTFNSLSDDAKHNIDLKLKSYDWTPHSSRLANITSYKSFVGREFKLWIQVAVFMLHDVLSAEQRKLWQILSEIFFEVYQTSVEESQIEHIKKLIQAFMLQAKKENPTLLRKSKTHMLLHLPSHISDFGPSKCYCTERCEQFMGVVRSRCIYSNYKNLSKDVTMSFSKLQLLEFIMRGGIWKEGQLIRQCGPKLRKLYDADYVQRFLNGSSNTHVKTHGQLALKSHGMTDISSEELTALKSAVGDDIQNLECYGGVYTESEKRMVRIGQTASYKSETEDVAYGFLRRCVNVQEQAYIGFQKFIDISKYCSYIAKC